MKSQNTEMTAHDLVERICEQGCTVVRQHIETLINAEKNNAIDLPKLLTQTNKVQQKQILDELISVMAVYDNKDCDENKL